MRGLVVGNNLNATAAIGQVHGTEGLQITLHHRLTPQEAIEYLRHAGGDVAVFLCDCRDGNNGNVGGATGSVPRSPRREEGGPSLPPRYLGSYISSPARGEDEGRKVPDGDHAPLRGEGESAVTSLNPSAPEGRSPCEVSPCEVSPRAEDLAKGGQSLALDPQPSALNSHVLQVADLILNVDTRIARRGKKEVELTRLPFRLLKHLMDRKGEICSWKEILLHVWGYEIKPGTSIVDKKTLRAMKNTVAKAIDRLREDIDPDIETRMIETVQGKGYRLVSM